MAVLEELGSKLTDIAGIKVSFPVQNDKEFILKIYARLCLMYDETWDFGNDTLSFSCKKILRLLNRVGIAHLTPTAADVVEPRRLPRVWSAFIAHLEQKYGSQGLYPRLRKVLKQQQILAARREAERERQQRMAGSARSPSKSQLGDISVSSSLSQDSQEDVRFAKPFLPVPKARHASASSGSSVSPSKGGVRSRIPVATRPNLIPTGKQLARTPSLPAKSAAAAPNSHPHMVQLFGSPRLVAPQAASTLAAAVAPAATTHPSPSPTERRDSGVFETASSTDASPPGRRRSLIPAAKTPEQALGEYIESQLNAHFPHETDDVAKPAAAAAAEVTLNVTYSSERPAPVPRAAEQVPSPAAEAKEAILRAAGDATGVHDKENVQPPAESVVAGKPNSKVDESATGTSERSSRRGTFELTSSPTNLWKWGDADLLLSLPVEQPTNNVVTATCAEESSTETAEPRVKSTSTEGPTETVSAKATEGLLDLAPVQPAQESSVLPEEPAKKRRGRRKKDTQESESTNTAAQDETQPEAPKKRGGRSRKPKTVSQGLPPAAEVAPTPETAPVAENPNETVQEPTEDVPKVEAWKKRGGRVKKAKQVPSKAAPSIDETDATAVPDEDATAPSATNADAPTDIVDQTRVADLAVVDVQPVHTVITEEAPKKRRGRTTEPKVTSDTSDTVPHVAENVVQHETVNSVTTEAHQAGAVTEAPKKRRGRAKKDAKPAAGSTEDEPSKPENPVPDASSVTEPAENTAPRDSTPTKPAKVTEDAAAMRRCGRVKKTGQTTVAADTAPVASESVAVPVDHPQPSTEPAEEPAKPAPARTSRRKTAPRTQKSTDSETGDDADPTWTPGAEAATCGRRGKRAVTRQASQPAQAPEDAAVSEPNPAAGGGRGRRARQAETERPAEENVPTAEPSGGRAGRATRGGRASTDQPASVAPADQSTATAEHHTAPAARRSTRGGRKTPEPVQDGSEEPAPRRRRRLRVVPESDSEGGTPPEPARADVLPSPAPPQRTRRARKTAEDSGRPRRALRALENCN